MGRDVPDGVLKLVHGNRLQVEWHEKNSAAYFERVRATMKRIAHVLGADYADNPIWFRRRVISVHPLGGAPMGRHEGEGVCDSYGEVFGHPGLYICDGSAMPGAVGANPSLTIAAFADRMADNLLDSSPRSWPRGPMTGNDDMTDDDGSEEPDGTTSLSFTEEMKGHYTAGVSNPRAGELDAEREPFRFQLTIATDDVDRFLAERTHTATATGWIESESCGGRREVERGWFNLFVPDGSPDRRLMKYRLHFTDGEGNPRTLTGWKNVFHGPPTDIWPDTSTLFFRVMEGHTQEPEDEHARIVGAGTLHILLTDFAHQLTTFRAEGAHPVRALARFGRFFAGELWDVYRPEHQHV
jgi:cholesterol oxidase